MGRPDDAAMTAADRRVALVTGGGSGIGRATVVRLVRDGLRVLVADIDAARAEDTVRQVGNGGLAEAVATDVSTEEGAHQAVAAAVRRWGRLDVLVNNVGVSHHATLLDTSGEDWSRVLRINLDSVFWCSREAIRVMVQQHSGVIVNVASVLGLIGARARAAYCELRVPQHGGHAARGALAGPVRRSAGRAGARDRRAAARPHRAAGGDRRGDRLPRVSRVQFRERRGLRRRRRVQRAVARPRGRRAVNRSPTPGPTTTTPGCRCRGRGRAFGRRR
jgi:NAD(P)-dependent dehydrogenase (short-subunit alcohol dehydrogenase family)